jgi:oxygen-independent coproporphyrinogen III oxidase
MPSDLHRRYARPVPRYTSYPTAPHFHAGIGARDYSTWLAALDPAESLSLYLHVPYCRSMCWYCGCNTKVAARHEPIAEHARLLSREIDRLAASLPARMNATHIHWGGGTPTILAPDEFAAVMALLYERFAIARTAEIAVEIDPRTLTPAMVAALAEAGVTRASLGVQDFDDAVQRAVNRVQPFEMTRDAVTRLRDAGVSAINFDLMYGLPHQTVAGVLATVDRAVTLAPQRIALFGYAHVPWMKRHQRLIDETALPDDDARWAQSQAAADRLAQHGYVWIGLDHFARADDALAQNAVAGRLRRNFQGYTTDKARTLLGLGPSAIGELPQGYVQNATEPGAWGRAIATGEFAVVRGIALDSDDRLRRDVIERLMCDLNVDLCEIAHRHGRDADIFTPERPALRRLADDGLITQEGERIALTAQGRPLMRAVAAIFDRYLKPETKRHSRAI